MAHTPADPKTVETELKALLQEQLPSLPADFSSSSDLFQCGLDSVGIMHLLIAIEDRYGIRLPDAEMSRKNLSTLGSLAALLVRQLDLRPSVV